MRYEMISGDCHVDLCWLPPDLFVENAGRYLRGQELRNRVDMAALGFR